MKLKHQEFMDLVNAESAGFCWLAEQLNVDPLVLYMGIFCKIAMCYELSKKIIYMFGAEKMAKVIDWEAMNVRNPLE